MGHYDALEHALQTFLSQVKAPLTASQRGRLVPLVVGLLLAGRCQLRAVARFVRRRGSLVARIQWVRRGLQAAFMRPEIVYEPVVKSLLATHQRPLWHLLIDRTHLARWHCDVLLVALAYRKRAVPLVWCRIPSGHAPTATCLALLQRCQALLPPHAQIVVQGDCEFGHAAVLRWIAAQSWDFILAQSASTQFQAQRNGPFRALSSLAVGRRQPCQVEGAWLGKREAFGRVNLYAFYQPHHECPSRRTRTVQYLATSLPLTRLIKVLGKRRWGIEALFRDWKSGGWAWEQSAVRQTTAMEGWLTVMALCSLWVTLVGRMVCQQRWRRAFEGTAQRRLSLAQLGYEWLVSHAGWQPRGLPRLTLRL